MTHDTPEPFAIHRNKGTIDCRPKLSLRRSVTASTIATTTTIATRGWWKECAQLVDTHALYPNLTWSCDSRIEESFPTAADGRNTVI
jgi:hypothetical protein